MKKVSLTVFIWLPRLQSLQSFGKKKSFSGPIPENNLNLSFNCSTRLKISKSCVWACTRLHICLHITSILLEFVES